MCQANLILNVRELVMKHKQGPCSHRVYILVLEIINKRTSKWTILDIAKPQGDNIRSGDQ